MMERVPEHEQTEDRCVPLVGRRYEVKALLSALSGRKSCLVVGPAGIGKKRLIEEALAVSRQPAVTVQRPKVLHELLVELAEGLSCPAGRFPDLRHATSVALKAVVLNALRAPRCVVLEDLADADPRMYRFLQRVYYVPGACLIVTARSPGRLGHLRKLLWDPREEIALKPLNRTEALALFESACDIFRLETLDVGEFRNKVLAAAQGNPGQIVRMCRMAGRPEYQAGQHIKFLPLRMDALAASLP